MTTERARRGWVSRLDARCFNVSVKVSSKKGGSSYSKVIKCDFLSRQPEDLLSQASPRGLKGKKRKFAGYVT